MRTLRFDYLTNSWLVIRFAERIRFSLAEFKLFIDNFAHAVLLPSSIALVGGLLLDSLIRELHRKFKRHEGEL